MPQKKNRKKSTFDKCPYCNAHLTDRAVHYAKTCITVPKDRRDWAIQFLLERDRKTGKRAKLLLTMPVPGERPRRRDPRTLQGGFCDGRKT